MRNGASGPRLRPCRRHAFNSDTDFRSPGLRFEIHVFFFQYDESIYEQQDGTTIGNPVSAAIANLYMEDFEQQALSSPPCTPKIWKRYVDDIFTILSRDNVENFLQHLNSQQSTICFTIVLQFHVLLVSL